MPSVLFHRLPLLGALVCTAFATEPAKLPDGYVSSRSFVDQTQIVSNYQTELYAHQSSLRIVKGLGYAVYQCNESTTEENKAGQIARMAVFNILNPTATAKWIDIAKAGDSSGGITLGGTSVSAPMIHALGEDTLRIFFTGRLGDDPGPAYRAFYRDYDIATATLSELHPLRCTIARQPDKVLDLTQAAVQSHLDHLFGAGTGASFAKGISTACDFVEFDAQLYSTIQIKNSQDGQTRLLTNILMRSTDQGATWELLGAPDPRLLSNEVKILAEPAITQDKTHVYLHLRSNVIETGYMLSKAAKTDLYHFDTPVTKWTYGIGRPTLCDFGPPIGLVAMFTAPSVHMGGNTVTRNKCDVVQIDSRYQTYTKAFSIIDYNAVNTPFMHLYRDEAYVTYSTGRRRLHPKFGTSEIVFSKLRREYFVLAE
ncbi:hypothetical protein [Prosthecobacter sp.]|uniref:hypothetical protein n=1 Tax=Prosthecobacter sp. TaxID=1965333 RepID=UPI003784FFF2